MPTMKLRKGSMMSGEKMTSDSIHSYAGCKGMKEASESKKQEAKEAKMSPKARKKVEANERY